MPLIILPFSFSLCLSLSFCLPLPHSFTPPCGECGGVCACAKWLLLNAKRYMPRMVHVWILEDNFRCLPLLLPWQSIFVVFCAAYAKLSGQKISGISPVSNAHLGTGTLGLWTPATLPGFAGALRNWTHYTYVTSSLPTKPIP